VIGDCIQHRLEGQIGVERLARLVQEAQIAERQRFGFQLLTIFILHRNLIYGRRRRQSS